MFLPVYLYGHPVLRKVCGDIDSSYPEIKKLIEDMWETMYKSEGVGLAAPQIGRDIRLFVVDADPMSDTFPECKGLKRVFINAQIIDRSASLCTEEEGCLSIPGIGERVERPQEITITYLNESFQPQKETLRGFAARVVQHEYDHIEGILFTDLINPFRKRLIRKKLEKIEAGALVPRYPFVQAPRKK